MNVKGIFQLIMSYHELILTSIHLPWHGHSVVEFLLWESKDKAPNQTSNAAAHLAEILSNKLHSLGNRIRNSCHTG